MAILNQFVRASATHCMQLGGELIVARRWPFQTFGGAGELYPGFWVPVDVFMLPCTVRLDLYRPVDERLQPSVDSAMQCSRPLLPYLWTSLALPRHVAPRLPLRTRFIWVASAQVAVPHCYPAYQRAAQPRTFLGPSARLSPLQAQGVWEQLLLRTRCKIAGYIPADRPEESIEGWF